MLTPNHISLTNRITSNTLVAVSKTMIFFKYQKTKHHEQDHQPNSKELQLTECTCGFIHICFFKLILFLFCICVCLCVLFLLVVLQLAQKTTNFFVMMNQFQYYKDILLLGAKICKRAHDTIFLHIADYKSNETNSIFIKSVWRLWWNVVPLI